MSGCMIDKCAKKNPQKIAFEYSKMFSFFLQKKTSVSLRSWRQSQIKVRWKVYSIAFVWAFKTVQISQETFEMETISNFEITKVVMVLNVLSRNPYFLVKPFLCNVYEPCLESHKINSKFTKCMLWRWGSSRKLKRAPWGHKWDMAGFRVFFRTRSSPTKIAFSDTMQWCYDIQQPNKLPWDSLKLLKMLTT